MTYRLLVTDLDGTLLPPDRRIPEEVREAVRAAQARGVRVCLATGRMWPSVRPFAEALGVDPPIILYNGAVVYDFQTNRMLHRRTLDPNHTRTVLALLQEFPEVQPHLFADDRIYVAHRNALTLHYAAKDGVQVEEVGDLLRFVPEEPLKILIVGDPADLARVEGAIRHRAPHLNRVFSEPDYLEILPEGVSKGTALRVLAAAVGVTLAETIAVGDQPNDLEMVRTAGLGVAVASAHPDLRDAARYVTRAGAGEAIVEVVERFILEPEDGS